MITYRNNNKSIKDYWPDNDENTLYLSGSCTLSDVLNAAKEHFGDRYDEDFITIEAEHIHTSCLTYDLYDPSDFTDFIIVSLDEKGA